ncbi:hypothetical protein GGTG_05143 [Gaeumannomyces tritici R3-111a-1]|uniref:Amino acid permease/ SLC12A domain-containing protein n=1 Tax=Gaeumannomyces tritici (strain R3-111a-1) TaxID=644352 RepID=J3NV31_GAET3|nr:hypothetical protein GGTG_05143 [Gaeumannomyces tritici R3-111a-1]EJT75206.1 hypothetical protein GGTG_05143 [Gaeumannomyces tritici R3-111a-1]
MGAAPPSGSDGGAAIVAQYGETKRGLRIGIGEMLTKAGPLSLVFGYTFWGLFYIWPFNLCVAEMCAYLPIRGSIFEFASSFVNPAFGIAMGWIYFFAGFMLVCTEYFAIATVIWYWDSSTNPAAWIAVATFSCTIVNVVAVKCNFLGW